MDNPAALKIRPATAEDIPDLLAIQDAVSGASRWSADDYLAYTCVVAEHHATVVGFVLSRQVADGEFEVLNTAVSPAFRRRGVAGMLLQAQLQERQGRWYLEVRRSNSAARNLYKKLGFQEIGERPGYYENPPEPAIVMACGS